MQLAPELYNRSKVLIPDFDKIRKNAPRVTPHIIAVLADWLLYVGICDYNMYISDKNDTKSHVAETYEISAAHALNLVLRFLQEYEHPFELNDIQALATACFCIAQKLFGIRVIDAAYMYRTYVPFNKCTPKDILYWEVQVVSNLELIMDISEAQTEPLLKILDGTKSRSFAGTSIDHSPIYWACIFMRTYWLSNFNMQQSGNADELAFVLCMLCSLYAPKWANDINIWMERYATNGYGQYTPEKHTQSSSSSKKHIKLQAKFSQDNTHGCTSYLQRLKQAMKLCDAEASRNAKPKHKTVEYFSEIAGRVVKEAELCESYLFETRSNTYLQQRQYFIMNNARSNPAIWDIVTRSTKEYLSMWDGLYAWRNADICSMKHERTQKIHIFSNELAHQHKKMHSAFSEIHQTNESLAINHEVQLLGLSLMLYIFDMMDASNTL